MSTVTIAASIFAAAAFRFDIDTSPVDSVRITFDNWKRFLDFNP
jgi:hypothetical protein